MSKSLLRAVVFATALIAGLPGAAFATSVDLSIYSITGSPDPITLGTGNVTYSVGIYNSSTATGTNVVLTNALPASSTYVSSSATNSGTCSQSGGTVTCSWASIPAGNVYFATIVVTPTAGGALTLSSSVTGTESDPNTINNSASKAVIVNSQIDLGISSMTVSPDPMTLGTGDVQFLVQFTNYSTSQATSAVLTSTIPVNSTFVSATTPVGSGSCSHSGSTVTCNWASIPAGGTYYAYITVTPTAGGVLTLSSSVAATQSDSDTSNNSGSKSVTVNSQIDLGISSMTVSPDPMTLGTGDVQFLVQYTNGSTSQATNVVLTSTLPTNSTFVSATTPVGSGTCSHSAGTVTCNWATIGPGSTYYAYITVTPTAGGSLSLTSTVSAAQSDPNTSNNTGTKASIVNSQIDLGISSMTVSPDPMTLGTGDVQFLVQYTNNSTSQATNAVLTSTIPVNSTFVSATTPVGSGTCSQSAGTVTCNWATIGSGSTYYAYITVTPTAGGVLTLSSSVSATQSDSNTSNNTGSKAVTVNSQIDLGISSMTVSPDPMTVGTGNVQFLVQYTNTSTSQATNVVLTSTLPTNSTFVSATTPVGSGTCSQSAGTVTCNWATIGAGSTFYAYITVTPTAAGSLSLTSTVSAAQSDPDTTNNTGTKASTVNSDIDLSISNITGSPDPITLGTGNVLYTVYATNNSGSQATNVVLTSTLPAGTTFVSATTPVGSGTCNQSSGTVTCNWASLPAGATYYAFITVTPTANGVITLSASVAGAQTDSNATNNSASKGVTVGSAGAGVDLQLYSISGTPDPITLNTGNVTYTVSIFNASSTTGTNTVLTNTLPANSTYVSSSATNSGSCSHSGSTVTCNWTSIPASGFYTATIVVTPTSGGSLTLSSSVAGTESDPITANNSASKSVTVNSQIDLQLYSISATPDPITLNTGNVTYTVSIYNPSTSQGTSTVLTNTLPANSTFVSASATNSGTCTHSGTVTCNWSSIPSSGFYTVTIVVTPTSGGPLTLTSSVSGTEADSNTANNSASKSVTVNSQIDLRLYSMSATPDPITLNNGNVTYTVSIYNPSTSQGTNTVLTNTLPANSTFVSASATNSGTCTHSGTVTCNWTSIPASGFYTATIVVTPTSGGSLTLSSSVAGTESDPNTADNSMSKSVTVNSQIDLQLYSISATPDPITLNTGNVTYTVSVYNPSTSPGTNTVLTNTLPTNSTFVSATATNSGTCTHSGATVTCNWTSIPSSGFYSATIVVTPTSGGALTLTSSVSGTESDSNTANNSSNKTVTVNSQIDLRVYSINATPDPITLNTGNVTYTVSIYNPSTSQGTNTVLTNTLPANSTFVSASATNSGTCTHSGTVTCNWTSIPSSGFYSATIVVTPTSGGSMTLSASVAGTESDPNTADNSSSKSVTVNAQIDLQLYSISATPDPITLNTGNVTYTVLIYNASSSQGTGTVLTSILPSNSTFVSATATNSGSCAQSSGTVTCNWTSIPATTIYSATIVVTPTSGGPLTIVSNVAGTESDSNPPNNNGNKSVTVNSQIDLAVYSISGSPNPITFGAGNVTFTGYAYNQSTSQGTNVVLTNTLPSNSTYVSSSASNGGTCSHSGSTVTCSWTSIPATTLYPVTIVVTPTIPGTLTLSASVAGTQPDPNTADNTGSGTTTVTPTACTAVPSGAVAWYRAESNAVDAVGPNTGTTNGGATFTTGEVGQAFSFNGSTGYVSVPDNSTIRPASLTLEGWVYFTSIPSTATIVGKTAGSGTSDSYVVWYQGGALHGTIGNTSGFGPSVDYTWTPTTNTWYHIAYTYDSSGQAQALYVNGAIVASGTNSTAIGYDANPLIIGAEIESSTLSNFFPGLVDELTLYSRALAQSEVQAVYGAGTFGKCYTAPSAPSITGFTPSSGSIGTSVVITGTNFIGVSSVTFNGTSATFTVNSTSQITATVPAAATTGLIAVTAGGGAASSAGNFTLCTPPAATITPSGPTTFCTGGSVTLTASAGTSYQWSNSATPIAGATAQQLTVTAAGSYTVTVTNAGGCSATSSPTSVTVNSTVTVTISGATTFCTGGNTTLTANPSGGSGTFASYQWILNGSPIGGATASTYNATAGGNYSVSVTDSIGCTGTSAQTSVTVNAPPPAAISAPASACTNSTVAANIVGGGVAGATYTWSVGNGALQTGQGTPSITFAVGTATPVSLSVAASLNGCTANGSASITVAPFTPTITSSGPTSFCAGGSVTLTSSSGASYQWFLNGSPIGGANAQSYVATAAGNYSVSVTTGTGCGGTSSTTTVTQNAAPSPTITPSGPTTFCVGGSVTLTSSAATSYQWLLNNSPIGGATASTYNATTAGSYSVTVTDSSGCTGTSAPTSVTVNAPPPASINAPASACANSTVGASIVGGGVAGATYTWSVGNSVLQTGQGTPSITFTVGTATPVSLSVVASLNGCTANGSASITVAPFTPTITASGPTSFCAGGSVTLTSSSGASYQWILNGSPIGGANAQSYVATAAGNYSVSVTTGTGCSGTSATTTVTLNPAPSPTITPSGPTTFCVGGGVTLTSSAATSYQWLLNNSPIGGATASTYNATTAGSYSVTVTNAAGCTGTSAPTSVTVNSPPPATINAPASACANSTVGASIVGGGVAGATYTWSVGNGVLQTGQGTPSITFTVGTATPVSLSVVASLNGCTANGNASITIGPFTPTITASGPTSFCAGGSVTLTSSSGASYQWNLNGSPIGGATAQSFVATAAGNYSVSVTTATGCSGTSSTTTVTQNAAPSPTITPSGPTTFCSGGSVTLTSSAATSYQWLLNGSPISGATAQAFVANATGSFSVTVTNGNGCSGTSPAVNTTVISSNATISAPSSAGAGSTGNTASVAPGPGGSTYAWSITGGTITSGNGTPSIIWTAGNGANVSINVVVTSGSCTASGSATVDLDSADLALTMTGSPNPVNAGDTITFTLNAANNGPSVAQDVRLVNNLFGVTAPTASGSGWSCSTSGLTVVCTLASLPAGPAAPVTITATAASSGSAGDNASLVSTSSDPNGNNNNTGVSITINAQPSCNNAAPSAITPAAGASSVSNPVTFTWSAAANATSYDLWIASSGAAPVIATTTSSTSATISMPSGPSTWYVAAHFANGCPTLFSTPRDLTVAASANCTHPAPQLTAPSPNAVVNSPVTFSWTAVAQAVGYRLWIALDGGAAQDVGTTNGATSLTVSLTGSSVVWHVDAIFPGCDPTSSASSTFTIASPDPCAGHSAPTLIGPSPSATLTVSVVNFQWTAVAGANGYRLWTSINGAPFAPLGTTASATTLHATFTSGTVAWYVEALFNGCASVTSAQQSFTIQPAPNCNNPAATSLAPANDATLTNGTVDFTWSSAPNAIGYELWLSFNNGTPSMAGTTTATLLRRSVGAGSIEWFVRAQFNGCDPVESAHARFSYAPPADCSQARPILTAPVDGASAVITPFDLQWSNVPGATQYKVWLVSGDGSPAVIGTTSGTHLDNQTAPEGGVTWFVDAVFDNCPFVRSTSSTFTAAHPLPPCSTPGVPLPRAESTASTNVKYVIRWTPSGPTATTQYEVQESLSAAFTSPVSITTDASEWPFKHVNSSDAPITYYYRVRAVGTCNGERSLFSLPLTVQVLPSNVTDPASANGSTPADNPQTTTYQIHIGGANGSAHKGVIAAAAGDTFTASTNQPWLTVSPSSGTVAPEGTTLTVTANTSGLPVGTSSGAVNITFGNAAGSQHGNLVGLGTTPPATTTVSVNLVQPVSPTAKNAPPPDALIIPAVAHADGINSKFQSDIRVTNSSAQPMKYQVTFMPTGAAGIADGKQTTIDIDPGHTIALDDVLQSWFGSNGATGTLEVRPLTTAPSSSTAAVSSGLANILTFAASRTYNTTANGTFGQYIPAIPFAAFVGRAGDPTKSTILSLQQIAQSPAFRTNLGIVEGSGDPASVLISVFGDNGQKLTEFTQDLKGGQQVQLNSILAQKNLQVSDGRIEVKVVSPVGKVTAYASVIDNQTNDPLLVPPVAVNQAAASMYVIPGVADLSNGIANWQTDVRVFNPSTSIVKATLTYYSQSGGTPQSKDISLAPGQVQTFDSALRQLFGISNDGGALHIATTATTPLVATARTYNQTANGTYGQFVPAVTANDAAALGTRPLQILQIEESDRYRTNVGFAEVTGNAAKIEVTAIPSDSKVAASTQIDLAANQFVQYPQLLKSMGLTNMYNVRVSVKVISGQGRVTAYASVIDMQTNDPTFVPAQ